MKKLTVQQEKQLKVKLRPIIERIINEAAIMDSFKYKTIATLANGEVKEFVTTLVGPALTDIMASHNVTNPDKLIDLWNKEAQLQQKMKKSNVNVTWEYVKL